MNKQRECIKRDTVGLELRWFIPLRINYDGGRRWCWSFRLPILGWSSALNGTTLPDALGLKYRGGLFSGPSGWNFHGVASFSTVNEIKHFFVVNILQEILEGKSMWMLHHISWRKDGKHQSQQFSIKPHTNDELRKSIPHPNTSRDMKIILRISDEGKGESLKWIRWRDTSPCQQPWFQCNFHQV